MNFQRQIGLLFILLALAGTVKAQRGMPENVGKQRLSANPQKKDSIVSIIHVFNMVDGLSRPQRVQLDTALTDFQEYKPYYENNISVQNLGNFGTAYQSNQFFNRKQHSDFIFLNNHGAYGIWPGTTDYYNTTTPYTLLQYGQWFNNRPNGETWLDVLHTQNVSPEFNFGIHYGSIGSQGQYLNAEAKDNNLSLFLSYNGPKYDLWFTVGHNSFKNQESGGLLRPTDVKNPDLKPENMPVWLDGANSKMQNLYASLSHQFKVGSWKEVKEENEMYQKFVPRVAFMHTIDFANSQRAFTETDPNPYFVFSNPVDTVYFYGNGHQPLINSKVGTTSDLATNDKAGERRVTNTFRMKVLESADRKYSFGKQAFIGNDLIKVYYPMKGANDTVGLTQSHNLTNTYIGGALYRTEGKFWSWNAFGKYYIQGYKFGDFDISGYVEKPIRTKRDTSVLHIYGRMQNETPDYFLQHYFSNHYQWDNNFYRTYNLSVGGYYDNPHWRLTTGADYRIVNNYIYFNENAVPEQASSEFSVMQAYLAKEFVAGGLHFYNKFVYQWTTTDKYLHLPEIMFRNRTYYQTLVSQVLHVQIGFDFHYESSYYADNYNPATGMFYVQNTEKVGNYPWLDAFINLKLKRTRFYLKYSNLGEKFMNGGYFRTPTYPEQIATMCFGVAWSFYN